jgi:hypothetical protein
MSFFVGRIKNRELRLKEHFILMKRNSYPKNQSQAEYLPDNPVYSMTEQNFSEEDYKMEYLIIGSGRVATHFAKYFSLKSISFICWKKRDNDLQEKVAKADVILLLIKDSAIQEFYEQHIDKNKRTYHCSGALVIEGIKSAHPLMTFGTELYDLDFYEKIYFGVENADDFRKDFPQLLNPIFEVKDEQKPLYHALCVITSNFPIILWDKTADEFAKLNVPLEAMNLILKKTAENFYNNPKNSLTGPLVRNDTTTIDKNINALPENLADMYRSFVTLYNKI